jgi:RimJ/RimL family protein N-acetyltransferase
MHRTIKGDGITLTRWSSEHLPALIEILATSRAHIAAWMPNAAADLADPGAFIAAVGQLWDRGTVYCYAILDADGEVAGHITLTPREGGADAAYWIRVEKVGRGLASDALRALIKAALAQHEELSHIELTCDAANAASRRVAQKAGFQQIAVRHREPQTPSQSAVELVWRRERSGKG